MKLFSIFIIGFAIITVLLSVLYNDSTDSEESDAYSMLFANAEFISKDKLRKIERISLDQHDIAIWDFNSISLDRNAWAVIGIQIGKDVYEFPPDPFPDSRNRFPLIFTLYTKQIGPKEIGQLMLLTNGGVGYMAGHCDPENSTEELRRDVAGYIIKKMFDPKSGHYLYLQGKVSGK